MQLYSSPLIVIADDITGAAEIAGIGYSHGMKTLLTVYADDKNEGKLPIEYGTSVELVVVATDTRQLPEGEAIRTTNYIAGEIKRIFPETPVLFKKTDSVMRGHIVPETRALMNELGYKHTFLLPQNPSKGRIIRNGIYYVGNTPLHLTSFAFDPEFPAFASEVEKRMVGTIAFDKHLMENSSEPAIHIADADSSQTVRIRLFEALHAGWEREQASECQGAAAPTTLQYAKAGENQERSFPSSLLLAGGADLFTTLLEQFYGKNRTSSMIPRLSPEAIIVCGSTQSKELGNFDYVRNNRIPSSQMPYRLFLGEEDEEAWLESLEVLYKEAESAILYIGYPPTGGADFAIRLRRTLSRVIDKLVQTAPPKELIIEGGATAFSILTQLEWNRFSVENEVDPGVVRLKHTDNMGRITFVTLKPGSYPWGGLFE